MTTCNRELARLFERIADGLELKGETGFRVLAYRRAARALSDLADDITVLDADSRLTEITGIGKAIAAKIHEYIATGRMKKYDELVAELPEGLFVLLDLQGIGPKTLRLLHEELGVNDFEDLRRTTKDGSAAALPGMGEKKVANIARAIRLKDMVGDRMYLNEALDLAGTVIAHLRTGKDAKRVTAAGSLRRGAETVGDIDILATGRKPGAIVERFLSHSEVTQELARGTTKASALFRTGHDLRQVDLRVVEAPAWGAALQYFTGSKDHNVRLRTLARRQGLKISEYGVFRGKTRIAGRTEAEVYRAVGLPLIPPELREDRGEFDAATENALPELVTLKDIRGDLHMHTDQSDGADTVDRMVAACRKRGYTHMAITDHSVSAHYAGGLEPDRLLRHCDRVDRLNSKLRGFRILKSSEVDITTEGRLDYPDRILARLDLVVASIHQGFRKNATERMCAALEHPLVHIIGHPSGRIIGKREGYDIDLDRVIETAARQNKALEINAFYGRLDLSDVWARKAAEAGVKLAVNTDAHAVEDLDWMKYGILTARRAWLTKKDIINCLSLKRLLRLLESG